MESPIPKRVLCHTVLHTYGIVKNKMGDVSTSNTRTISNVRVEPTSKVVFGKDQREKQLTGLMFYDCTNSSPQNVTFVEGDTITLNGIERRVQTVDLQYGAQNLHHIEVGLA